MLDRVRTVWSFNGKTEILDGKHVRRGEKAHMKTLQSLFSLYQEAFFKQEAELYHNLQRLAQELGDACKDGAKAPVEKAHEDMVNTIISFSVLEKMSIFDAVHGNDPMFQVIRHYMRMVMEMMAFIRAVRIGDWKQHLSTLEMFTKYFFSHDRINYSRMIPVYFAEMASSRYHIQRYTKNSSKETTVGGQQECQSSVLRSGS